MYTNGCLTCNGGATVTQQLCAVKLTALPPALLAKAVNMFTRYFWQATALREIVLT